MKFLLGGLGVALMVVGLYAAVSEGEGIPSVSIALSNAQKFDPGSQPDSARGLQAIFTQNPHCELSSMTTFAEVKLENGSVEYVAEVHLDDKKETVRLFKTHALQNGYKISGISHNGEVKVTGSVVYLNGKGTDVYIESVEHFQDGLVGGDSHKFCTFS